VTSNRPLIDWEAIEREYRMGRSSLRELTKRHGPSPQAILRRAAKHGWTQDKSEEVKRRVVERLLLAAPEQRSGTSESGTAERGTPSEADREAVVEEKVSIHIEHRKMARDFRQVMNMLVSEARRTTEQLAEICDDIEADTQGPSNAQRRARMMAAVSLGQRASTMANIVSTGKNIQHIERLAHNLSPALPQGDDAADQGPFMIVQFEGAPEEAPQT
jgi:hypothetical protein